MIDVTCKVGVIEVDGVPAERSSPLLVESFKTKGCGEGQYVTLAWDGRRITVSAHDLRVATANAARTSGSDDECPF